jgi:hypothetical protein
MSRNVLTYQAPAQLLRSDSLFQKYYNDCLHIVATSSLKTGLGESIRDNRWIKAPIITFSELFSEISGEAWSSSKAQLKQFLKLSDVIFEQWNKNNNLLILQSMERNQLQVLKTLRMLTELGVNPSNLEAFERRNPSEELFLDVWKEMKHMLTDDLYLFSDFLNDEVKLYFYIYRWADALINESDNDQRTKDFQRRNSNLVKENWQNSITASLAKMKLVLHGFYFITPIQEKVFQQLEAVGYELIFLNPYDDRFPNTFETVKTFLKVNQYPTLKTVADDVAIHPLAARLIESLEGESAIKVEQKAYAYSDLAHFVEAEKDRLAGSGEKEGADEPYHLLTPRADEVENQLIANEFVPPSKKKLIDYPVGRFLYRLHEMKNRENDLQIGTVTFHEQVTAEVLLECFSSGCLIVKGEDMRKFVKPLEKVLPYCKNCKSFSEWQKQINKLILEKFKWEKLVLKTNPHALDNQIHKLHALPMRQLSYFSVERFEMEKIINGIGALQELHKTLFAKWDQEKINITEHLNKIEKHLLTEVVDYLEGEEKLVVSQLMKDISELKDDEMEFSLKDISKGLLYYLGGTLDEVNNAEPITGQVFSFDHADAAPFRTHRKFHLAFADHKALPIDQGFTVWPVSRELIKYLEVDFPEFQLLEERKKQSNSITRYLLYVLFHSSEDVRFSYVKQLGTESRLELALYLKLLGCETESVQRQEKAVPEGMKEIPIAIDVEDYDWTESMKLESRICGKRATFSFVLNEHTTFKSDFHHGFLYQNFIDVLDRLVDKDTIPDHGVRTVVDEWFPQWNMLKRDFLYEAAYKSRYVKPAKIKTAEGKHYNQAINYLQLLPNSYASKNRDQVENRAIELHLPNSGEHCRYCPYLSLCKEGMYQMDYEEEEIPDFAPLSNSKPKQKLNNTNVSIEEPFKKKNDSKVGKAKLNKSPASLVDYLKSKNLDVIDNREQGGCLWVVGGEKFTPIMNELKSTRDITFTYTSKGGKATRNRPGWFTRDKG